MVERNISAQFEADKRGEFHCLKNVFLDECTDNFSRSGGHDVGDGVIIIRRTG